jgi:hypothetical protein
MGLPSGLFPSGFPTKALYTPLLSPIHTTCPAHLIFQTLVKSGWRSFVNKNMTLNILSIHENNTSLQITQTMQCSMCLYAQTIKEQLYNSNYFNLGILR